MTDMNLARRGYQKTQRATSSEKDVELQIFTQVTGRLQLEADQTDSTLSAGFAQALIDNAKLWNLLFIDLVSVENKLSIDLKRNLIGLAKFTREHTHKVLQGTADATALIEINKNIIAGLKLAKTQSTPFDQPAPSSSTPNLTLI